MPSERVVPRSSESIESCSVCDARELTGGWGASYIDDEYIAMVPFDAGFEGVLPLVHFLKPLARDDFVFLHAGELRFG